jgi:phosphoglycerate dehydrogenase-like enzyme
VKPICSPALWRAGVRVTSGAAAIAQGVAETCLGLILTVPKRLFWAALDTRAGHWKLRVDCFGPPFEVYRQKVGVIGAGHIGRRLIELLGQIDCEVLVYDPYLAAEAAAKLGATKVETLEELFSRCRVVSLNAPTTDETRGMLRGRHFALLPRGAVFINTARHVLIHEPELLAELAKGRFVAVLDVTEPEPPPVDYPLRRLPNVILTPHMSGTSYEGRRRIGRLVADEIEAFLAGRPLHCEVTEAQLAHIA